MRGFLESLGGLLADGIGGNQPQHHGIVFFQPGASGYGDGMRGQQGFAAAGRQAQTDVGHAGQFGNLPVGRRAAVRFLLLHGFVKRLFRVGGEAGAFKIRFERFQGVALKIFQFHLLS